ncbi:MAG: Organic hydroperoxide resistance protein [uncultured Thermomicrobiales bacterium]|uniref:Organic hydroperoxide resistance protein n=1 Tax=uncultured Thermomicrobiales bacterium TaxID=1645740 RepID=A0A6J4UXL3_9BACT|nr:MAG: Organic hydroperoxide resistance protein [uncultured Thermomicrobiales bacterium]
MAVQKIEPSYTARVTAVGARNGHVSSDDGVLSHDLKTPGGKSGETGATNPEQLFAAGYAACFQGALFGAGRKHEIDVSASKVEVDVSIGKAEDSRSSLAVAIRVTIPDIDRETTQTLADAAHETCPYSRATRGNIEVTVEAT